MDDGLGAIEWACQTLDSGALCMGGGEAAR